MEREARKVAGLDEEKLLIVQHLLLGINAHVNHDLALAVVEMAAERGEIVAELEALSQPPAHRA